MRLAAFRRHDRRAATPRVVGLVLGQGEHLRVHPFADGADLVELLAADAASGARRAPTWPPRTTG